MIIMYIEVRDMMNLFRKVFAPMPHVHPIFRDEWPDMGCSLIEKRYDEWYNDAWRGIDARIR